MSDTTYLNKVKPESGKTVEFEGADILARNVRITDAPLTNDALITKQYFENNRAVSQINTLSSESSYEIQNSDLTNYSKFIIYADSATGNQIYTLPPLDVNQGKVVRVQASTLGGKITIQGKSGEKIGSYTSLVLQSRNDYLEVVAGHEWEIIGYSAKYDTGWQNRSSWQLVHPGTSAFDYDNLTGTFTVGELITEETSGNTGIIQSDTGSLIYVKDVTGTGIWTNNKTITGATSGATALVNEGAGTNKNQDTNILHDLGINFSLGIIKTTLLVSTDKTEANTFEPVQYESNASWYVGFNHFGVDSNNIHLQTGTHGLAFQPEGGGGGNIQAQDWHCRQIIEVKI